MAVSQRDVTDGNIEWHRDPEWERPMVDTKGRERFDLIDRWLHGPGLLCRVNGTEHMFVDTSNYWCNLASFEALSRLNSVADIFNATVQFDKSARPFLRYVMKRCNANVAKPLPTSVCIGTRRLEVEVKDDGTIEFIKCRTLLTRVSKSAHEEVGRACFMPIDTNMIPASYRFPGSGEIVQSLVRVFPDVRDLVTVMWHIGNCIVDPVSRPKSMMLCGPGGSGKSVLLQTMFNVLSGCCGVLPDGCLTDRSKGMSNRIAEVVVSSRMAVCFDVDLEKDDLNMSVFKNISGSDYVRVGYTSIKTNCSLTLATNGSVNPDEQPTYHSDAIMRRVVCVLMNVAAINIPAGLSLASNDMSTLDQDHLKLDFVCACIHTRIRYDSIPVSPMSLLLTLCGTKIDDALSMIKETSDDTSVFEGAAVLTVLSTILSLTAAEVAFKARLVSSLCVIEIEGEVFIKGLCLKRS